MIEKQNYSMTAVREMASAGFDAMRIISRDMIMKRIKSMPYDERRDAVRALQHMERLATNPALHFSRETTYGPWMEDLRKIQEKYNLKKLEDAAYLSNMAPSSRAFYGAAGALDHPMNSDFWQFAKAYEDYEYNVTNPQVQYQSVRDAQKMDGILDYLLDRVIAIRAGGLKRKFKEFKIGMTKYPTRSAYISR